MQQINAADFTLQADRGRIAISACYELEGLTNTLARLANDGISDDDCDVVRGLALRARDLSQVLLAITSNDVNDSDASMTVFGFVRPEFVKRAG